MAKVMESSNRQLSSKIAITGLAPSEEERTIRDWEFSGSLSDDPNLINYFVHRASIQGLRKALGVLNYYYRNGGQEQGFDRNLQERVQAYQMQSGVKPEDNTAVSMIRYGLQDRTMLLEHVVNPLFFPAHLAEQLQEQVRIACYPESQQTVKVITSRQLFLETDLPKLEVLTDE
jgi:hypothetical protein